MNNLDYLHDLGPIADLSIEDRLIIRSALCNFADIVRNLEVELDQKPLVSAHPYGKWLPVDYGMVRKLAERFGWEFD